MAIPVAYPASMRRLPMSGKAWWAGLALALVACAPAGARELVLRADAVRTGAATLEQVEVRLVWPEGAAAGQLRLDTGRLSVPLLGYDARGLAWTCPLVRDIAAGEWRCDGELAQAGRRRGTLSLSLSPAALDAVLAQGPRRVAVGTRAAAPGQVRLELARLPVAWLQAFLAQQWPEGQWTAGEASGRLNLDLSQPERVAAKGRLALTGLGLETPTGWLAAAGVDASLSFAFASAPSDTRVQAMMTTKGGEFLAQSFYAPLPATPVRIEVEGRQPRGGGWRLSRLVWRDPGVLEAEGSAVLAPDARLSELDLHLRLGELAVARDRYLSGFLAPAGFPDLVLSGRVEASLQLAGGGARSLDARLQDVNAVDPRQRFILSGVDGDLRWRAGKAADSALGWRSAALFGIGLGPVRFDLRSAGGELALRAPAAMDVLGGRVALEHLRWWPPDEEANARFELGVRLDDLDLGSLSQRLGWPPFTGELGGRIPSARYARGVLALDGGLAVQAFGGTVVLSDLVMERPFGIAPTLSADVAIDDVDLEPMTAAFGFGSITGRLDGRIAGLRMVDWSPVAFDARLQSDPAWRGRRRISQRAVEDISRVGGAGLLAGLQARALRLFDDFGYKRLGLACRLRDNVCRMDGVDSAGDGYTIVEGAGLPRIQVVGFRRRVDWPTLVARLKAATEGQVPVVQ